MGHILCLTELYPLFETFIYLSVKTDNVVLQC